MRKEAISAARRQAMQHQPFQVVVLGRDGEIRTEHTYGNDPRDLQAGRAREPLRHPLTGLLERVNSGSQVRTGDGGAGRGQAQVKARTRPSPEDAAAGPTYGGSCEHRGPHRTPLGNPHPVRPPRILAGPGGHLPDRGHRTRCGGAVGAGCLHPALRR
ncbi:DUF2188 domain-containing protein [Streptomyces sp. NPDC004050]